MNLVIVESPAKARTIEKYLGPDYRVLATYGHICDLPSKDGSVRPDEDFAMDYVADAKSAKRMKAITDAAKQADRLLLATDPDREGEAISWHVLNHLEKRRALTGTKAERVVFHEITREAVLDAVANPRAIDMNLVNAQQARRAPVLWRKVPGSRSAGRVQSVSLRLIVDREMEIEAFKKREFWTIEAALTTPAGAKLSARLVSLDGNKLDKFALPDQAAAEAAVAKVQAGDYAAVKVERKQTRRNPAPPFTTSTLQQEAARKLGFAAQHTMRIAQRLYEGVDIGGETAGLISYMRTDSVTLSNEALDGARRVIRERYGEEYLPEKPRRYATKAKNAQEAHEAIRPTDPARVPDKLRLAGDEARLYELIWKRTVASQMAATVLDQVRIDIASPDAAVGLRANGSTVAFDGFIRLYTEGRDDPGKDDEDDAGRHLPKVEKGDALALRGATPERHFTEPPPRYSEASLVKRMEELGIGRPSTYANIIAVLQDRDYVVLDKKRFVPEDRGRLVTAFLESFFERYVEYDFTARLEDQLDQISNGTLDWKVVLRDFWSAFSTAVEEISDLRVRDILDTLDQVLAPHIFPETDNGGDPRHCPRCDDGRLSLKLGKFGAFVGCSTYPECRFTRQLVAANGEGGGEDGIGDQPKLLGNGPDGEAITLRKGPYGLYVQAGEAGDGEDKPKRSSLPKGLDAATIELETAVGLLSLPRDIGAHPESGKMIAAGIGRYGPYVKHDGAFKSLKADDDVLSIGINRAVVLLAEPSRGRGAATPLRVLGKHPEDDAEVAVFSGRYGPYVKHNRTNATLPKGETPEGVTLDAAVALLAERAAKMGTKKGPKKAPKKAKAKRGKARKG